MILKRASVALGAAVVSLAVMASMAPAGSAAATSDPLGPGHAWLVHYKQTHGYLPIGDDFAAYERNVALRNRRWAQQHAAAIPSGNPPARAAAPTAPVNFEGQKDDRLAPGDPTGAAGPKSYIQFINDKMGIYTRTGELVKAVGTGAFAQPSGADTNFSDPQILWDPYGQRFFYAIIDTNNDTYAWGFSKTSNPTDPTTGFCNYNIDFGYGGNLPDYPKLGQTQDFLLIGSNVYNVEAYVGSNIDWISKPAGRKAITSCPAASTFKHGQDVAIKNSDGQTFASDPNPAQQADFSSTGWVVAVPDETNSGATGNFLTIFKVTKNPNGTANIPNVGTQVNVNAFAPPPSAPQMGSNYVIDTLDGRLTHAVSAVDPAHGKATALWTGQTIAGGAGAEYQWYEIDVEHAAVFQQGDVSDASLFVFNGGIAPDRLVKLKRGSTYIRKFGSNAVIGLSTSSAAALPAVQMVSKKGSAAVSGLVMIKQSPGPDNGFDCTENPIFPDRCRWGDYSGAAPDPAAPPSASAGQVWLTNMRATGTTVPDPLNPTWTTQVWEARP